MRIERFRVQNYKSFIDSGEIELSSGFNVVVGANNVGKTALLEALGLRFPQRPHRSLRTLPTPTTALNPNSVVTVSLSIEGGELRNLLLANVGDFYVPVPTNYAGDGSELLTELFGKDLIRFTISFAASAENQTANVQISPVPTWRSQRHASAPFGNAFVRLQVMQDKAGLTAMGRVNTQLTQDFGLTVANLLRERIYVFRAERMNIGRHAHGPNEVLAPTAANLPEVLHMLQTTNPRRFQRFNALVQEVFPSIFEVSVRPTLTSSNTLEIVTWTEDPTTERGDLAIELTESGTGVSQVLAMLYVVTNSKFPRTIIIDEPNSFLHPGAARKLVEILKRFPEHQYIITTHSPEIIAAADPSALMLIRWQRPESKLERLDVTEISAAERCLSAVGARLSDVFGADSILWVEGQTEEQCFELLRKRLLPAADSRTSIVAVRNTGDLDGKHARIVLEIYKRLSTGNALLPRAVGFVFDQDGRTRSEMDDIIRQSKGAVKFISRRTYENYLLNPTAIALVLSATETRQTAPVSVGDVEGWLRAHGEQPKYFDSRDSVATYGTATWRDTVNAPKLLGDMFMAFSDGKETYQKTLHSVALTEWFINNAPMELGDLTRIISEALSQHSTAN